MSTVYAKTPKGLSELESRAGGLKPKTRRILILIDGRRDLDEVTRLSVQDEATVTDALRQLLQEGYIDLASALQRVDAPLPMPTAPLAESDEEFAPVSGPTNTTSGTQPTSSAPPPPTSAPIISQPEKKGPNITPTDPFSGMIKF